MSIINHLSLYTRLHEMLKRTNTKIKNIVRAKYCYERRLTFLCFVNTMRHIYLKIYYVLVQRKTHFLKPTHRVERHATYTHIVYTMTFMERTYGFCNVTLHRTFPVNTVSHVQYTQNETWASKVTNYQYRFKKIRGSLGNVKLYMTTKRM